MIDTVREVIEKDWLAIIAEHDPGRRIYTVHSHGWVHTVGGLVGGSAFRVDTLPALRDLVKMLRFAGYHRLAVRP